jgi:GNAT superfamily N-acetyltransferase
MKLFITRNFTEFDIRTLVEAFEKANVQKSSAIFEKYLQEQCQSERVIWIAHTNEKEVAGYVTLTYKSLYPFFADNNIPEIMDLNVLPQFRRNGIGTALIKMAETEASNRSNIVGLGVGLYGANGYGAAQKLYVKMEYIPDGNGVTYRYEYATPGCEYLLDDDFVLWFTKKLKRK